MQSQLRVDQDSSFKITIDVLRIVVTVCIQLNRL